MARNRDQQYEHIDPVQTRRDNMYYLMRKNMMKDGDSDEEKDKDEKEKKKNENEAGEVITLPVAVDQNIVAAVNTGGQTNLPVNENADKEKNLSGTSVTHETAHVNENMGGEEKDKKNDNKVIAANTVTPPVPFPKQEEPAKNLSPKEKRAARRKAKQERDSRNKLQVNAVQPAIVKPVNGDEAGTLKGIISKQDNGKVPVLTPGMDVKFEGNPTEKVNEVKDKQENKEGEKKTDLDIKPEEKKEEKKEEKTENKSGDNVTPQKKSTPVKNPVVSNPTTRGLSPVIDVAAEVEKFKTAALQRESGFAASLNQKIGALKGSAMRERNKITSESALKRKEIVSSYDVSIANVNKELAKAIANTQKSKILQKQRVQKQQSDQKIRLDKETATRVANLEKQGEGLAKDAEKYGADQSVLIRAKERTQRTSLAAYTNQQINYYIRLNDAEGRRGRMNDRLGGMRDDTMQGIRENNDKLIEQVKSDAGDLAQRLRDEYKETASSLPEHKQEVIDTINQLAKDGLAEIDSSSNEPIEGLKKNAAGLIAQLKAGKTNALAKFDETVKNALKVITDNETAQVKAFTTAITNYKSDSQSVVKEVETKANEINPEFVTQLTGQASAMLEKQKLEGIAQADLAIATKQNSNALASSAALSDTQKIATVIKGTNTLLVATFANQATSVVGALTNVYVKAANKANTGMSEVVDKNLADLDKTSSESIAAWVSELAEGKADIAEKIQDVQSENDKLYADALDAIKDEAEQLSSEWEVTYWGRRILSVIGDIISAIVTIVLAIIAIVIAIILLVLAVIALIALLVVLIEALVALVVALVALIVELVVALVVFIVEAIIAVVVAVVEVVIAIIEGAIALFEFLAGVWGAVMEFLDFCYIAVTEWWIGIQPFLTFGNFMRVVGWYFFADGVKDVIEGRYEEGIFKIVFSVLGEWEMIWGWMSKIPNLFKSANVITNTASTGVDVENAFFNAGKDGVAAETNLENDAINAEKNGLKNEPKINEPVQDLNTKYADIITGKGLTQREIDFIEELSLQRATGKLPLNTRIPCDKALSSDALRVLSKEMGEVEIAQIFYKTGPKTGRIGIVVGNPRSVVIPFPQAGETPYLLQHVHPGGTILASEADIDLLNQLNAYQKQMNMPLQKSSGIIPEGSVNQKFNPASDYVNNEGEVVVGGKNNSGSGTKNVNENLTLKENPIPRKVGNLAGGPLENATQVSGKFLTEGGPKSGTLFRADNQGNITSYATYDSEGLIIKRVDVTGAPHNGIPTPHVKVYGRNTLPNGTVRAHDPGGDPRPATVDEIP